MAHLVSEAKWISTGSAPSKLLQGIISKVFSILFLTNRFVLPRPPTLRDHESPPQISDLSSAWRHPQRAL